jgi:predicted site-specific integrase-resolvase
MPIRLGKKKLYSVKELTSILHITSLTVCEYLRKGKIAGGFKVGKNWYVSKENLETFLGGDRVEG